jgi:hypothetical protein
MVIFVADVITVERPLAEADAGALIVREVGLRTAWTRVPDGMAEEAVRSPLS